MVGRQLYVIQIEPIKNVFCRIYCQQAEQTPKWVSLQDGAYRERGPCICTAVFGILQEAK